MTIFQAEEYDFQKARRRKIIVSVVVVAVIAVGIFLFIFRNWPEEHLVNKFMTDLQHKDYKGAYGLWVADKDWQQHPDKHAQYPFQEFIRDWGPGGDWGEIQSFRIEGSEVPKVSYSSGNGVVVMLTINGHKEPTGIWVTKSDHSMTFSPFDVVR